MTLMLVSVLDAAEAERAPSGGEQMRACDHREIEFTGAAASTCLASWPKP